MQRSKTVVGVLLLVGLNAYAVSSPFEKLDSIRTEIASLSSDQCVKGLNQIAHEIENLDRSDLTPRDLRDRSFEQIEKIFKTRLQLREKIVSFHAEGQYSQECAESVRTVLRRLRGVEDYLGNTASWAGLETPSSSRPVPRGYPQTSLVNPQAPDSTQLKSGDLLISRGTAYTSAAIARLGTNDTQFSHLALFYRDEKTAEEFTVEAHIEIGVIVTPFSEYFKDGKVRSAIFRFPNASIAHSAAKLMYERVKVRMDAGNNVPYDFSMDSDSPEAVFCSEVARLGYRLASKDQILIPHFQSQFKMKNRSFLQSLGADRQESFLPEDIELDPRFTLIAEWRNYRELHKSWRMDAMLTAAFDWMEHRNYAFRPTVKYKLTKDVVWLVRHTPILGNVMREKFPKNMSAKTLETIMVMEATFAELAPLVEAEETAFLRRTGFAPTYFELLEIMERIRAEDARVYEEHRKNKKSPSARFHRLFR